MIGAVLPFFLAIVLAVSTGLGGYAVGKANQKVVYLQADNSALRESNREVSRQVAKVQETQKVYHDQLKKIDDSERRYRAADRLRQQAERDRAIATSSVETCRAYAATVTELFETCRAEYIDMGHEAERSRAAAEALN